MSAFKLHTLKQKLWAVFAASAVARVIMFFALPNTPSPLAPDEGTYASLAKWVGDSRPASDFPAYGEKLYNSGRTILVPASFLYRIGINELNAVRLVSTTYAVCTLAIIVLMATKLYSEREYVSLSKSYNDRLITCLVFIFAFLPSHFVWSSLGLRESATEFWVIATFVLFLNFYFFKNRLTFTNGILFVGSITFTFSARPQVGWALVVSLIIFSMFQFKQRRTFVIIPVILFATLLGGSLTLGIDKSPEPREGKISVLLRSILNTGQTITIKQEANQTDAASVIETPSCPRESSKLSPSEQSDFDTYFCILWRSPFMVSTFLFRPAIGVDVTSTSSFFAAVENLAWLTFFVSLFVLIAKKRQIQFLKPLLPAVVFFNMYVLGASAYQGNMGTAFRHKSLILWVLLLLLFALFWQKDPQIKESRGYNSQENAV